MIRRSRGSPARIRPSVQQRRFQMIERVQFVAATGEIVVDAAQDQRAAQLRRARHQLVTREPVGAEDAVIEPASGLMRRDVTTECNAHGGSAVVLDCARDRARADAAA